MASTAKLSAILLLQIGRTVGFVFVFAATSAALLYVAGMAVGLLPGPWTCVTLERQTIAGPAGTTIEMVLTNCDLIAKWERVVVYAKQHGTILGTRLFEYDPAYDMPFPQITFSNDNDMLITVPAIGSIIFQRDLWNGHRVSYRIGKTYFPDPALDAFASKLAIPPADAR